MRNEDLDNLKLLKNIPDLTLEVRPLKENEKMPDLFENTNNEAQKLYEQYKDKQKDYQILDCCKNCEVYKSGSKVLVDFRCVGCENIDDVDLEKEFDKMRETGYLFDGKIDYLSQESIFNIRLLADRVSGKAIRLFEKMRNDKGEGK